MNKNVQIVSKVIHGDALKELSRLNAHSADLIFFDPPYNVGKKYDGYDDKRPDYRRFMRDVLACSRDVAKRGVVVFMGARLVPTYLKLMPDSQLVVVHKRARGFKQKNFVHQYHALLCEATPVKECLTLWNDIRLPGEGFFYREPRTSNPGQTSLELTKRVIETFTEPDEIVLDPFMGSGTTALACAQLGRKFIGIEQSVKYIAEARERMVGWQSG